MSTHNVCFHGDIRKISLIFDWKSALSEAMYNGYFLTLELMYHIYPKYWTPYLLTILVLKFEIVHSAMR